MERTAGINLASEEHRLVAVESDGRRLEERRYSHSEDGIAALVKRLLELDVCRVAIERPNGLVVDRLLEAGIAVVPVHPNQLAASRDRYRSGGGKSDGFDGYVLAELARTDMHRLRLLEPDVDSPICLAFLERYPSPEDARLLGEKRLAAFLARNGYCGRRSAAELLERLRSAPEGRAGAIETEARRGAVLALVAGLRPL